MPVFNRLDIEAAVPLAAEYTETDGARKALYDQIEALVNDTEEATKRASLSRREMLQALAKTPAKMEPAQATRLVVELGLRLIEAGLGQFMQTTHGRFGGRDTIKDVLEAVATMHEEPTAFNVSEASQAIRSFLKERKG